LRDEERGKWVWNVPFRDGISREGTSDNTELIMSRREKIPRTDTKLFHKKEIGFTARSPRRKEFVVFMELLIFKPSKIEGDDDLVHYFRTLQQPLASLIRTIEGSGGSSTSASRKRSREQDEDEKFKNSTPVCNYLAIDDSGRALVLAAHRELLRHEASLSTNKRCASVIELLLRSSSVAQLTRFGASLLPYLQFLSTNRHASHVLQTFLSLSHLILNGQRSISEAECAVEVWDTPLSTSSGSSAALILREFEIPGVGVIPSVYISLTSPDEVLKSLTSLIKVWTLVMSTSSDTLRNILYDSGGTHVLRALIGVLTGVETESLSMTLLLDDKVGGGVLVGEKEADPSLANDRVLVKGRGRSKKEMKRTEDDFELVVQQHPHSTSSSFEFKEVFIRLSLSVLSLSNSNAEELGALGCDVNASATLQLLIKASSIVAPNICKVLCRSVSNWGLEGLSKDSNGGEADLNRSSEGFGEEIVEDSASTSKRKSKPQKQAISKANLDAATDIGDASNNWLHRLCTHSIGSRLVECVLNFADPPLFNAFVESFFKAHIKELCADPYGNFSIQKLLISVPKSLRSQELTDALLMETSSCIGMLIDQRKSGVLLHIAAAAAGAPPDSLSYSSIENQDGVSKHNIQISYRNQNAPAASESVQGAIITAFVTVSAKRRNSDTNISGAPTSSIIKNDPSLARQILCLPEQLQIQTPNSFLGSSAHFPLPKGPVTSAVFSLTLAHLLRFSSIHSRVILNSFLSLTPYEISSLATDPTASRHILEPVFELQETSVSLTSVLSSDHVWAKNKLHSLLKGFCASLAVTRFGSWVISKAFTNLDIKRKASIAAELVEGESRLRSGSSAQISTLLKMMRIEQFKTNRIGWEAYWVKDEVKKREILENIQADADHAEETNSVIMKEMDNDNNKVANEGYRIGSAVRGESKGERQFEVKRGVSTKILTHVKALGFSFGKY